MRTQRLCKWIMVLTILLTLGTIRCVEAEETTPTATSAMDEAMMEGMKYSMPGEAHKIFEPMVGLWDITSRMWMKPGDQPQESKGTSDHTWKYDGRFLAMKFNFEMDGHSMEGVDFLGYDNFRGEYQLTSLNNMSTSMMHMGGGTYDPATKTLTIEGKFSCPMTGNKDEWMRSEWIMNSNTQHTYQAFFKDESGKEYKAMELVYTKK